MNSGNNFNMNGQNDPGNNFTPQTNNMYPGSPVVGAPSAPVQPVVGHQPMPQMPPQQPIMNQAMQQQPVQPMIQQMNMYPQGYSGQNMPQQNFGMNQANQLPQNYNQQMKQPNKGNFKWGMFGLFILIAGISLFIFSQFGGSSNKTKATPDNGTRTIMIYMVGSDLESKWGAASADIKEMVSADVNLDDVNVIVYAGGTKKWRNDFENNGIYELTQDGFQLVKRDETNKYMGDPNTLTFFLDYVYKNYNSDLYDLVFWNHGSGPILGFGADETTNSMSANSILSIEEIKEALRKSSFSENNKLELVGFDACLMSSVEIAVMLSEFSHYLVASQETEPGGGWNYDFLGLIDRNTTSVELGRYIVDTFYDWYVERGLDHNLLTLSLVDLSKMDDLNKKIDTLFSDVDAELSAGGYSKIVNQIRTEAKCFQCDGEDQSYDLIDLYGAVTGLSESYGVKATTVLEAIEEAVVYQRSNVRGAYGLSIYYPYYSKSYFSKWLLVYNKLDFSEGYKRFVNNYVQTLTGSRITDWDFTRTSPTISSDQSEISVVLPSNVLADYQNSRYIIFKDTKDGYFIPVFSSSDTTLKPDGTLVSNFNKKGLAIKYANGDIGWIIGLEHEVGPGYTVYSTQVILYNWDADLDMSEWEIQRAYILIRVDAQNPNGKVMGFIPAVDMEDQTSLKQSVDLSKWKFMEFWNFRYKILDSNGNFTWDWQSAGNMYGYEVSLSEKYTLSFVDLEKGYDYYCLFVVNDTQGNSYTTNLVKIQN